MPDLVECFSSHAYPGRPTAFYWEGDRLSIQAIESQWRTPEKQHFCVHTADQQRFELIYEEEIDEWRIQQI